MSKSKKENIESIKKKKGYPTFNSKESKPPATLASILLYLKLQLPTQKINKRKNENELEVVNIQTST